MTDEQKYPEPPKSRRKGRSGYQNSMFQALAIQRTIFSCINPQLNPEHLAKLTQAWDTIEERKRILRNKPLPGVFKPEAVKKKRNDLSNLIALSQAAGAAGLTENPNTPETPET